MVQYSVNQRLKFLSEALGFPTIRQFGQSLGYEYTEKLYRIVRDPEARPSFEILHDILTKYPKVNAEWLLLGVGNMFKSTDVYAEAGDRIIRICEAYGMSMESLAEKINQPLVRLLELTADSDLGMDKDIFIQILEKFPDLSPNFLLTGQGNMKREAVPGTNKFIFEIDHPGQIEIIYRKRTDAV